MKLITMGIVICLMSFNVCAQTDSIKQNRPPKTTITLASIYSSNISYYGQVTDQKLPYILGNATVQFPFGLYTSTSLYKLLHIGTGVSGTDLGIGFSIDATSRLSLDLSYTRSFFPSSSPLLQAGNKNTINITAAQEWPWFKSALATDFAFGSEQDLFLGLLNSKTVQLGSLFSGKDIIAVEPSVEIVAGTQHFYTSYIEKKNKGNNANGNNKNPSLPPNSSAPSTTTIIGISEFKLLSCNFKLPLNYYRTNYMLEASYQLSLIGGNVETTASRRQSFIGLGFYYQF